MKDNSILTPLFKQIDEIFFRVVHLYSAENEADFIEIETEEEFDVKRSVN